MNYRTPQRSMGTAKPYYLIRVESHARNRGVSSDHRLNEWYSPPGETFANGDHTLKATITPWTNPNQEYALIYEKMAKPFLGCEIFQCETCKERTETALHQNEKLF